MKGLTSAHAVAQKQHGAIAHARAIDAGMSESGIFRCIDSGLFVPEHVGVYRVGGTPVTWHQKLMMATLAGGDLVVASHSAAAAPWELPRLVHGPIAGRP